MPRRRLAALFVLAALAVGVLCGSASATTTPPFSQPAAHAPAELSFSAFLAAAHAHRIRSLRLPDGSNVATVVLTSGATRTSVLPAADTALLEQLAGDGVDVELGSSGHPFLPPLALSLMLAALFAGVSFAIVTARRRRSGPGSLRPALKMGLRPGAVAPQVSQVRFDDVAGCPEAVEELLELVEFLTAPERFARLGAKTPRAALLYG